MGDEQAADDMERMADEIFELTKMASAARAQARVGQPEELTETEFLTLDALVQNGTLTVGEIQKRIGVLAAQMSRIIRSLESKNGQALVSCAINPDDRRKINVKIEAKGRSAHRTYRAARMRFTTAILNDLSPEDRKQFIRILRDIRAGIDQRIATKGNDAAQAD